MTEARAEDHLDLVRLLARKMRRDLGSIVELDELEGPGMVGLVEAVRRYDERRGASFRTFASYRIRGAMLDAVRIGARHARRERSVAVVAATSPEPGADELLIARETGARLTWAVAALPPRERQFIERIYFGGRQQQESGAELGLSKSWSSRLHTRAVGRLREAIES